jgi:transcription initiation factor TFIIIB Brf1 subunit/transcription initiation factor TFIIB
MIDDIVDQNKALGLIYQRIVNKRGPQGRYTEESAARALDIIVAHEVHGITFSQLAEEYGVCKQRIFSIHASTMRLAHDVLKSHDF